MPYFEILDRPEAPPEHPEITDEEGAAMALAVVRLFGHWGLADAEACTLLGGISPRTYQRWKSGKIGRLSRDIKTRLSNLVGIHKALRIIFRELKQGYSWVSKPNVRFGGLSALEVMLGGEMTDLIRVRRYLDAERGGW